MISEEVAKQLNIRWKHANWQTTTADSNLSDLTMVGQSIPVNIHGNVIRMSIQLVISGLDQVVIGHPSHS